MFSTACTCKVPICSTPEGLKKVAIECIGETWGTFLMVLLGTGVVASAVLTGAQVGLWQVASVWGFAVTISIYSSGQLSGA
jgi:glycerol uptake facilitator protein